MNIGMKKEISMLIFFALLSWVCWIIETKPLLIGFAWVDIFHYTFIVSPMLFCRWAYFTIRPQLSTTKLVLLCIIYPVFFLISVVLVTACFVAGPHIALFFFSPVWFLVRNQVACLALLAIITWGFNFSLTRLLNLNTGIRLNLAIFASFLVVPLILWVTSVVASATLTEGFFDGFNNLDPILWFKSGLVIPVFFTFEGLLLMLLVRLKKNSP